MILKLFVAAAALLQIAAAAFFPLGSFEQSVRPLPVFIQPASWAFSIWGLIYTLSLIYAVYQLVPRFDNDRLEKTRVPALVGFIGSMAWLYFAGQDSWLVWFTFPTLLAMALSFATLLPLNGPRTKQQMLSRDIILPYAAWTMIATWINAQTLLVEKMVVTTDTWNVVTNILFFIVIMAVTLYSLRRTHYSLWYGGVLMWASVGIVAATIESATFFSSLATAYAVVVAILLYRFSSVTPHTTHLNTPADQSSSSAKTAASPVESELPEH